MIVSDEQKRKKEFYEQHNSEEEKKIKKEFKVNGETGKCFFEPVNRRISVVSETLKVKI